MTNASVRLFQSDTTSLLGEGDTGTSGTVNIEYSASYSGPVVVAVIGDADAQYYDEAAAAMVSFGAGQLLRAMVPAGSSQTGVTMLTEVAYQLSAVNSIGLTNTAINQLNERVRLALAPELSSILTAPTTFSSATTTGSLGETEADKYALRLAALAQLGSADASPALTVARQLSQDFADGTLDGQSDASAITGLVYNIASFVSDLAGHMTTTAGSFGTSGLQTAITGYSALQTQLNVSDLTGASGGGDSTLTPSGDGAALAGVSGATGTVGATTYTYTGHPVANSPLYAYFPISNSGIFTVFEGSNPITRWTISGFPAAAGTYSCGGTGNLPSISLTLNGVPYLADECTIEVLSVDTTEVEGRFAARLQGAGGELGTVTDGYFLYNVPVSGGGAGLGAGEFGYSMDVDGVNITNASVPALDGFDRQVANFLTLGDTPTLQIRMIPEGVTGNYSCGSGPNAFRIVGITYAGHTSENTGGNCSISVTSAGAVYEGTFSGTLYNSAGSALVISNGVFRNDGSQL